MVLVSGAARQLVGPSFHQKQLSPWLNEDPLVPRQTSAFPKTLQKASIAMEQVLFVINNENENKPNFASCHNIFSGWWKIPDWRQNTHIYWQKKQLLALGSKMQVLVSCNWRNLNSPSCRGQERVFFVFYGGGDTESVLPREYQRLTKCFSGWTFQNTFQKINVNIRNTSHHVMSGVLFILLKQ